MLSQELGPQALHEVDCSGVHRQRPQTAVTRQPSVPGAAPVPHSSEGHLTEAAVQRVHVQTNCSRQRAARNTLCSGAAVSTCRRDTEITTCTRPALEINIPQWFSSELPHVRPALSHGPRLRRIMDLKVLTQKVMNTIVIDRIQIFIYHQWLRALCHSTICQIYHQMKSKIVQQDQITTTLPIEEISIHDSK